MSTSSNNHQADVKMRWERQERETAWAGKMVGNSSKWNVCQKVVCQSINVCERVVCDNVVCEGAVCHRAVCEGHWMSPSATPATETAATTTAPPEPAQCHKCHACHTKWGSMSPNATPTVQSQGRTQQVPHLPHKMDVDVGKCHACHTNSPGDYGAKRDPIAPPEPAQCHEPHACHTKWKSMSPSATLAPKWKRTVAPKWKPIVGRGVAWTFAFFSSERCVFDRLYVGYVAHPPLLTCCTEGVL